MLLKVDCAQCCSRKRSEFRSDTCTFLVYSVWTLDTASLISVCHFIEMEQPSAEPH